MPHQSEDTYNEIISKMSYLAGRGYHASLTVSSQWAGMPHQTEDTEKKPTKVQTNTLKAIYPSWRLHADARGDYEGLMPGGAQRGAAGRLSAPQGGSSIICFYRVRYWLEHVSVQGPHLKTFGNPWTTRKHAHGIDWSLQGTLKEHVGARWPENPLIMHGS